MSPTLLFEFWPDPSKGLQVIIESRGILLIRSEIRIYRRRHRVHFLEVILVLLHIVGVDKYVV